MPAVPTLIVNGAADLRTPLEDAAAVQTTIPGAQLVGIPHTGHSVLGAEAADCGAKAVASFFTGQPAAQCTNNDNPYSPTPRPPLRLTRVSPYPTLRGTVGRTAAAVCLAVDDGRRQVIGELLATGSVPRYVGGLRSGYAKVSRNSFTLHGYEYVPGVRISGTAQSSGAASRLTVSGSKAAKGRLKITAQCARGISGRLGGRKISVRPATARAPHQRARHVAVAGRGRRSPAASAMTPNALAQETSPYLRQHAENPVDWLPWGDEALQRAARRASARCSSRSATAPATGAT